MVFQYVCNNAGKLHIDVDVLKRFLRRMHDIDSNVTTHNSNYVEEILQRESSYFDNILKDIDPVMFQQAYSMAYTDMTRVINLSNSFSRVVSTSTITPRTYSTGSLGGFSRSGGGGFSSFGGGGGFSGGGHSGVR